MNQKSVERNALVVSIIFNSIMAVAGVIVFAFTQMKSMFLDGFFSLISSLSLGMGLVFSKTSKKKNASYPTGMFFLEPFYAIIKSLLMLGLLIFSLYESGMSALEYVKTGSGNTINPWIIIPYSIAMVAISLSLSFYNKKQNKKINNASIMLTAESKSNIIDGVISGGIGFLVLILLFVPLNGKLRFLHFTGDFFITLALFVIFIKEPIKLFLGSIREISGATVKDKEIKKLVRKIVSTELKDEDLDNKFEVYKIGMNIKVVILLQPEFDAEVMSRFKKDAIKELKEYFDSVIIEFVIRKNF